MASIALLLGDEHPLIQAGFRGLLRLGADLEVRIIGFPGTAGRGRDIPDQKRRALTLIASGCGPSVLAERLGLCLEHSEALHEELTRDLGLDRIAKQVRSALRVGKEGVEWHDTGLAAEGPGVPDSMGDRMMGDIDLVRSLFPKAQAQPLGDDSWAIVADPDGDGHNLGEGRSSAEAWGSAAARLALDDWFRPIIAQLRALRSEQGAGS